MIYLIMKIFLYLLVALIMGMGVGWLIRNIVAARKEDELNKSIAEVRARIPQLESLMRTRDDQAQKLRTDVKSQEAKHTELRETLRVRERELRDTTRQLSALNTRNAALDGTGSEDLMDVDLLQSTAENAAAVAHSAEQAETIGALLDDIERTRTELAQVKAQATDAASLHSQSVESASTEVDRDNESLVKEVQELQTRLRQKAQEQDRLAKKLETEQRKLVELEMERELQNKSLQVLHQQLELERERKQTAKA